MPLERPADLRGHAGRCEGVVQCPGLAIKNKGIRVRNCHKQVDQPGIFQGNQRVFQRVGVEIANDEKVGIAAAGRVCFYPCGNRGGGIGACNVAISLTVVAIDVTGAVT